MQWFTVSLMLVMWVSFQVATYGVLSQVLKWSDASFKSDFLITMLWGLPLALLEFFWLCGWRMGERAGFTAYTALIIQMAAGVIGSIAAMYIYFREIPSGPQLIALILTISGIVVSVLWGGGK